jgi:hypothetical protein
MKEILKNLPALLVLLLILGVAQEAFAQVDPPDRVARLNFIEGAVSYLPSGGDQNDWVAAVMNRPLTTGDRLWSRPTRWLNRKPGKIRTSAIPRIRIRRIRRPPRLSNNNSI